MAENDEKSVVEKLKVLTGGVNESPMCASCPVKCAYRDIVLGKDKNSKCPITIQRDLAIKNNSNILFLDSDHLHMLTSDLIILCIDYLKRNKANIGMATILIDKLIKFQSTYYPATQRTQNMNINIEQDFANVKKEYFAIVAEEQERKENLIRERKKKTEDILKGETQ